MTEERFLAIRTVMRPKDTNWMGSIFGGTILSLLDMVAAQHAVSIAPKKFVTKVMHEVNFIAPVQVGDAVICYTSTRKLGSTSVTIQVDVEVQCREDFSTTKKVTNAEVVMVAVDDQGKPTKIKD